jgi:hypothetical protein
MKILTKEQLDRARQLAMAADALVWQAEAIIRGAHRTHDLRFDLGWAEDGLRWFLKKLRKNARHYDPPRTRKVERMERMERERKERQMKRVTMGGSPAAQGAVEPAPSGTTPDGQ